MDFLRSIVDFVLACWVVVVRRLTNGPLISGWGIIYEAGIEFLRRLTRRTFEISDIQRQRAVANSLWIPTLTALLTKIRHVQIAGIPARMIVPGGVRKGRTVLYLHGGAYVFYVSMHDRLVIPFALLAHASTLVPEYKLAPEHPYPSALEDSLTAYRWLLDSGADPQNLVVAGDSAGGGLAVSLMVRLRELGLPLPRMAVLISPWVDLSCSGESMKRNRDYDWISRDVSLRMARYYMPDGNLCDPDASPLYADLSGLPLLYIQGGEAEVLHDQIHAFAAHARSQGVEVMLEMYPGMVHEFQAFDRYTVQSRRALTRIGKVIDQRLGVK